MRKKNHKEIFICHSSKDRDFCYNVCTLLENHGISCWVAPRDIRPGFEFDEEIIDAINSAKAVVFVLSSKSNISSHVKREISFAAENEKMIYPIRIEDILPSKKLAYYIRNQQFIDAWEPPLEEKLKRLIFTLGEFLGRTINVITLSDIPNLLESGILGKQTHESTVDQKKKKKFGSLFNLKKQSKLKISFLALLIFILVLCGSFFLFRDFDNFFFDSKDQVKLPVEQNKLKIVTHSKDKIRSSRFSAFLLNIIELKNVVRALTFSPDNKSLIAVDKYSLNICNINSGKFQSHRYIHGYGENLSVAFWPDDKSLAVGQWEGRGPYSATLTLFDFETMDLSSKIEFFKSKWNPKIIMFSPDRKTVAIGQEEIWQISHERKLDDPGFLVIYDLDSGNIMWSKKTSVSSLSFSPDGKLIATVSKNNNQMILWDAIKGEVKISLSYKGNILCFSPDGNYLAIGSDTLELWDLKNSKRERDLHGFKENISALTFSPKGKLLVSGHTNGDVYIWNSHNGHVLKEILSRDFNTYHINTISFSKDGSMLASGCYKYKILLWKISGT